MFKNIFIILLLFSSRSCDVHAQVNVDESEHNKLAGFVLKGIFNNDEIMNKILPRVPSLVLLGFHLSEKKEIDSVSVQCSDAVVAAAMRKMSYDKCLVRWDFLIAETDEKALMGKGIELYVPIFIIKDLDQPNKPVFSKDDIEAIFFKGNSGKTVIYSLKNTMLLKPIEIKVSSFH